MRKSPPDEVVAAARRRLELLGRELDQAGVARLPDVPAPADPLPPPGVVHVAGRHAAARPARPSVGSRLADLVPDTMRGRVALDPMNPFERKIVHDAVAAAGLTSESEGEEPRRHVVVLPAA